MREWNIGTCLKCTSVFIRVIAENETVDTVLFNSKYNYVTTMGEYSYLAKLGGLENHI